MSGDEFRRIRLAMSLKQEELAALMGVTQATVSRWENGHLKVDTRTATTLRSFMAVRDAA